uniref:Peptidase S1 domain-containing protein n=1 Tax=Chelydra serpentina TaxID=8475 RepID=A0A8C3SCF9_CHESE
VWWVRAGGARSPDSWVLSPALGGEGGLVGWSREGEGLKVRTPGSLLIPCQRCSPPGCGRSTWKSADVALLQLTEPVPYTDEILPVCLPGSSDAFPGNRTCWVTGWGSIASEGKTIPRGEALSLRDSSPVLLEKPPLAAALHRPCLWLGGSVQVR